ncbi:MAG: DoxX family protein [Chitinophagales bacterium]|nr:DoxX family protein [Chitinophagales bacterium]
MRKLMTIKFPEWAFTIALLVMRLCFGIAMMPHGYKKLLTYSEKKDGFMDFMGLGGPTSLALVIFAEFVCSGFIVLGLFTRLAVIPLIVAMSVAFFKAHNAELFGDGETSAIYLSGYIAILLLGPGKISVDGLVK